MLWAFDADLPMTRYEVKCYYPQIGDSRTLKTSMAADCIHKRTAESQVKRDVFRSVAAEFGLAQAPRVDYVSDCNQLQPRPAD